MKIVLLNKSIEAPVFTVPEFNFGQMQRWAGHEHLQYSIEIHTSVFVEKFGAFFETFRQDEIIEDDTNDLDELEAYKEAGWPTLIELFDNHIPLLKDLIIYHEYEILHLIVKNETIGRLFYSINSIDTVSIGDKTMKFEGICFEVTRNQ